MWHSELIDCLYLVRNGVPFDIAFSLPPEDRLSFIIALGTLEGRQYDYATGTWVQQP